VLKQRFKIWWSSMFKFLLSLFCLILVACQSSQGHIEKDKSGFYKEFDISVSRQKKTKVTLLPHQKAPIEYLYKNKGVKGLLINHGLGTGKTFLSLGFCEKYPDRKKIILIPDSLVSNWAIQMRDFGVSDDKSYEIVTYSKAPQKLLGKDLSQSIVIIDEVHKFFEYLNSPVESLSSTYIKIYMNLQKSYKILALTGTPIYNNVNDIGYIFNLVTGQDIIPYNDAQFKAEYMSIERNRAFFRGHFTESFWVKTIFPIFGIGLTIALTTNPYLILAACFGMGSVIPFTNSKLFNIEEDYSLRSFNVQKLSVLASKHVSYYKFEDSKTASSLYPSKELKVEDFDYNKPQMVFYMNYLDRRLKVNELRLFLEKNDQIDKELLKMQSSSIQEKLQKLPGNGRQIGNFSFLNSQDKSIEDSPKFDKILEKIKETQGQIVVYSNFYDSGLKLFESYLKKTQFKNSYEILDYRNSLQKQITTLENYNKGKIKILLLHPEFTEGISLKGTSQLHILEPVQTSPKLHQISGRVIRYKSHMHLPQDKRHVDIYVWKARVKTFNLTHYKARKENWQLYYSELNDFSNFGSGLTQVDPEAINKKRSPDEKIYDNFYKLNSYIHEIEDLFAKYSIENKVSNY
jgi:superfamily II DNA or RNA helicase